MVSVHTNRRMMITPVLRFTVLRTQYHGTKLSNPISVLRVAVCMPTGRFLSDECAEEAGLRQRVFVVGQLNERRRVKRGRDVSTYVSSVRPRLRQGPELGRINLARPVLFEVLTLYLSFRGTIALRLRECALSYD
jgi:hypothetical protein